MAPKLGSKALARKPQGASGVVATSPGRLGPTSAIVAKVPHSPSCQVRNVGLEWGLSRQVLHCYTNGLGALRLRASFSHFKWRFFDTTGHSIALELRVWPHRPKLLLPLDVITVVIACLLLSGLLQDFVCISCGSSKTSLQMLPVGSHGTGMADWIIVRCSWVPCRHLLDLHKCRNRLGPSTACCFRDATGVTPMCVPLAGMIAGIQAPTWGIQARPYTRPRMRGPLRPIGNGQGSVAAPILSEKLQHRVRGCILALAVPCTCGAKHSRPPDLAILPCRKARRQAASGQQLRSWTTPVCHNTSRCPYLLLCMGCDHSALTAELRIQMHCG